MEGSIRHFQFAPFQFLLKTLDTINLPAYKGSTLRGAFGHAFKKVVCVNKEKICGSCLLRGKCVYSYVFETPSPSDTSKMRKYPFAPHPFVVTPPLEEKRTYRQNEALCFELTLIGKSIDFLPHFIYTFDELGKMGIGKGKDHLEQVSAINIGERSKDKGEEATSIYSGKDRTPKNNCRVLKGDDLMPFNFKPLTLNLLFLTPTRLKFDGNLSPRPKFHILFRNLLRRISLLSYFHCGEELGLDFRGLIEKSKEVTVQKENLTWFDWERYSNCQETKMKMGGFIGSITFEGNLKELLPFIILGEYIHVGKGISFGLGKYKIG
jgi:CRISPR-associated endoribonuclease Cas6